MCHYVELSFSVKLKNNAKKFQSYAVFPAKL